jgi:hypothetical protein
VQRRRDKAFHGLRVVERPTESREDLELKNIQVIDGADNSTYSIFAATDEEFEAIFPAGADIEFIEDFVDRVGEEKATKITVELWKRPVAKKEARGIHGTLFYQLTHKKRYYPTKKESEMVLAL